MSQVERNRGAGIAPGLYAEWGRTYNRYHADFPGFSGFGAFGATLPLPTPLPVRTWPDGRRHTLPEVEATGRPEEARIYASTWFHVAYKQAQKPFSNRVQDRWINAANLFAAAHNMPYSTNQFAAMIATIKSANAVSDEAYRLQQQETQSPSTTAAAAADASFAPAVPVPPASVSTGLPVTPTPTKTIVAVAPTPAPAKSTPTSTSSVSIRRPQSGPAKSDPSTYLDFTPIGPGTPASYIAPGVKTPEVVRKAGFFSNIPWWALPAAAVGAYLAFGRR